MDGEKDVVANNVFFFACLRLELSMLETSLNRSGKSKLRRCGKAWRFSCSLDCSPRND